MSTNLGKFRKNGFAIQLLPSPLLDELVTLDGELRQVPARHWTRVIKYGPAVEDLPLAGAETEAEHARAVAHIDGGALCYSFQRIRCIGENLALPAVQQLKAFLLSPAVRAFIREHAQREVANLHLFYVNKFGDGDFLTTHRDAGDNLALVINVTRDWNPNNGGITFLLDQEHRIMHALNPQFGQALLLDCRDNTVPHFVSAVNSPTLRCRTAIVARYS